MDEQELQQILARAEQTRRGGKPAKYPRLADRKDSILELMRLNVSLPLILEWLNKNGEEIVLNTLRKFVIYEIGRDNYDDYLKRNGWYKARRQSNKTTAKPPIAATGKGLDLKSGATPLPTTSFSSAAPNPFADLVNETPKGEPRRNKN